MSILEYWFIERDEAEQNRDVVTEPNARRYYELRQELAEQEIERMLRS